MLFAFIVSAFTLFAYWQGWFLYHRWNHFLTVMRWVVPFTAFSFYDRWESKKTIGVRQSEV